MRRLLLLLATVALAACDGVTVVGGTSTDVPPVDGAVLDVIDVPVACSPDQARCNNRCVSPLSDDNNCGGCGRACAAGRERLSLIHLLRSPPNDRGRTRGSLCDLKHKHQRDGMREADRSDGARGQ